MVCPLGVATMNTGPHENRRLAIAKSKLAACIRLARESSRDSWQLNDSQITLNVRKKLRMISRECIQDARYWKNEIERIG